MTEAARPVLNPIAVYAITLLTPLPAFRALAGILVRSDIVARFDAHWLGSQGRFVAVVGWIWIGLTAFRIMAALQ